MIHEIQKSFDESPLVDVRGIFSDIFKAFDKVWHKSYGISGNLFKLIESHLTDRKESAVLYTQTSS